MNWFGTKPANDEDQDVKPLGFDDYEVRLGDLMRGERATLGKSLLDVQRELHIRATYIAAIESGDLSAFEAASFVAGYVRSYARYLDMDPDWCYAKFCAETNFAVMPELDRSFGPKAPITPNVNREMPQGLLSRTHMATEPDPLWRRVDAGALGSIAVLIALIVGIGYGGWSVLREVQRVQLAPADQAPEVMTDLDPVMTGAVPRTGLEQTELRAETGTSPRPDTGSGEELAGTRAQGMVRTYQPEALEAPVMVSRDGPIASINPRSTETPESDPFRQAIEQALADSSDGLTGGEVRVTESGPPVVEVLAVRPSWVRVRAADGTVLFERILDAGERYTVPQSEEPPILRAGNSGSVYFMVDGDPFGPAAPGAQVVDNLALSHEAVTERFELADITGDSDLRNIVNVAQAAGD